MKIKEVIDNRNGYVTFMAEYDNGLTQIVTNTEAWFNYRQFCEKNNIVGKTLKELNKVINDILSEEVK